MGWNNGHVRRVKDGALVYEAEMLAARLSLLWLQARPWSVESARLSDVWAMARRRVARRRSNE
jgi:hypothetical protein